MEKLVGVLVDRRAAPELAPRHVVCPSDPTDAILASLVGAAERPEPRGGLVCAWPRDARELATAKAALAPHASPLLAVREVVHWSADENLPEGMVVLVYFVRRRSDLSFEDFEAHYRERHAPLARVHHPGIARYVQNFAADGGRDGIDAVSELWFRSEEDARTRFYRDDESRRVIGEDVRRFLDLRSGFSFAARPRTAAPLR
jgi:uncharacterized protein (TIGR02118 family)